jgi:rare lipoprotein A
MKRHFAATFVVTSAFLAAASGGAHARGNARSPEPPIPRETLSWVGESGVASYYGPAFHGRQAASGARFDQTALTAAHPWLPFGTRVKVTLTGTSRTVIVTITDRLYFSRRILDLSVAAARRLGIINRGLAEVSILPV